MILTIGIVVYNEEKNIRWIQRSIEQLQSYCRVIVIDNGSSDSTLDLLTELKKNFSFEIYHRTFNHLGEARANIVSKAETPWVGFIDADCKISETWGMLALQYCRDCQPQVGAFGGPLLPLGNQSEIYQLMFSHFLGSLNSPQVKLFKSQRSVRHIPTANVVYRRELLLLIGSFSTGFQFVGEDLDVSYRILQAGYQLMIYPSLAIGHFLPKALFNWCRKVFKYGRGRGRVASSYGDIFSLGFVLPWVFSIVIYLNVIYLKELLLLPLVVYFLFLFFIGLFLCIKNRLSLMKSLNYIVWVFATQFSYSQGMVLGTFNFVIKKILRASQIFVNGRKFFKEI